MLSSESSTYIVGSLLGQGSFGTVTKCIRKQDMKMVAIKTQKKVKSSQIKEEIAVMSKLRKLDPDKGNIVRFYEAFNDNRQFYLVFEHLEQSLDNFINERQGKRLLLKEIRPIVCQLANTFNHLSTLGLIHTDLKLDNVMLVNHRKEPYRVKLIDFGLAIDVSAAKAGKDVQPIPFMCPEILLGLSFTEAIDMWSLGIMAASMFLGKYLYASKTYYETIRYIVESLGLPPDHMLHHGLKTLQYFKRVDKPGSLWRLQTPQEHEAETGITSRLTSKRKLNSLDDLLHIHPISHMDNADKAAEMNDGSMFLDMLKGMLELDPKKRIKPCQVLQHPFITGTHLVTMRPFTSYVQSCYDIMHDYQSITHHDNGEAVRESLEEPTAGLVHPVQSNGLPNETSGLSPSTPNKSAGIKRKVVHVFKRLRAEWHRSDDTATTSRNLSDQGRDNAAVRIHPIQQHSVNTPSCQQRPDQDCIRTGNKRKLADDENDRISKRFQQSDAAPSTLCRNSLTQTCVPSGIKRKRTTRVKRER